MSEDYDPWQFDNQWGYSTVPSEYQHYHDHRRNEREPLIFVRKNLITMTGKFFTKGDSYNPSPGDEPQPTAANAVFKYCAIGGGSAETIVGLDYNSTPQTWSGSWDSSACIGGRDKDDKRGHVFWMVYSTGAVVAAKQGWFIVLANRANDV